MAVFGIHKAVAAPPEGNLLASAAVRVQPQAAHAQGAAENVTGGRAVWDGEKLNAWLSQNVREDFEMRGEPRTRLVGFSVDCGRREVYVGERQLSCSARTYGEGASAGRLDVALDVAGAVVGWTLEGE